VDDTAAGMTDLHPTSSSGEPNRSWERLVPKGSLGLILIGMFVGAAWADERGAPATVTWTLTGIAVAGTVAAVVWCAMPFLRLQRDPVLRQMALTPWTTSRRKRPAAHERERR
jgi:hypothetical protein